MKKAIFLFTIGIICCALVGLVNAIPPSSGGGTGTLTGCTNVAGALTCASFTAAKVANTASVNTLYNDNGTQTIGFSWKGPHQTTAQTDDFIWQVPTGEPATGQVMAAGTVASHTTTATWVTPVKEGTATGGILLGDSTPDTDGELGYASTQLSVHDGTASRSLLQVASTTITKYQYFPIRYAEDNATGTAPAAAAEVGTTSIIARSFAEDADNVVAFFWQVDPEWTAGLKYRVYYVLNGNASANNTVVFDLAGCSVGNSDSLACAQGAAVEVSDELTTDDDQYELMVTGWSGAVTVTNLAVGEIAKLVLWRDVAGGSAEDDYGDHALVVGIEIKYQAKISASTDY
jgi:hypothetical protein